jgi:hypothetical protein
MPLNPLLVSTLLTSLVIGRRSKSLAVVLRLARGHNTPNVAEVLATSEQLDIYGVPGDLLSIGGTWYRVYASDETAKLSSTKLHLADLNNQPTGYKGAAYEWAKGYQ